MDKNHTICGKDVYDTKLGDFLKDLEQKYGYDEYTNLALLILYQIGQNDTPFKPYLGKLPYKKDIIPRQPPGVAYNYWSISNQFETEATNMPIISII